METTTVHRPTQAPVIETARLRLRPYRLEDFVKLRDLYQTDRSRHIGGPLPEVRVWYGFMDMNGHWPIFGFGGWAVELTATGDLIGEVAISRPVHFPETELGWLLYDGFEGKGYAFEAALAARHFGLSILGLETLVSYIDPENRRSIRLAEQLGASVDSAAATPNGDACLVYRHRVA